MSYFKKIFFFLAVIFACAILLISFQSSSKEKVADNFTFKQRRFYIRKEILPDHSLYPLLMGVDRLRLAMADEQRRAYLLAAYANRRLFYAKKLADHGNSALALTTFTKAEKYLNQALREAKILYQDRHFDREIDELVYFILESANDHLETLEQYQNHFVIEDKTALNLLESETGILTEELTSIVY